MRFPRPCLDCQKLHSDAGDYCALCRRDRNRKKEQDPVRIARKRLLYSSSYKAIAKVIRENATHCHLCKKPFTDRREITADHLKAGDPTSPLAPAHKTCNSRRGNKPLTDL